MSASRYRNGRPRWNRSGDRRHLPGTMMSVARLPADTRSEADRLSALYAEHVPDARRLAYLLTGDRALAEDLAQEAFIRVMGRLPALRSENALRPYLRRTVVNLVRARHRSALRERSRVERASRLDQPPVQLAEAGAESGVWELVRALPARQRAALVLRFWLDLSEAETARLLRCRPGTVKSLVSRGLTDLRRRMPDD